jgi:hypothetical protein
MRFFKICLFIYFQVCFLFVYLSACYDFIFLSFANSSRTISGLRDLIATTRPDIATRYLHLGLPALADATHCHDETILGFEKRVEKAQRTIATE